MPWGTLQRSVFGHSPPHCLTWSRLQEANVEPDTALRDQFTELNNILAAVRQRRDLGPALQYDAAPFLPVLASSVPCNQVPVCGHAFVNDRWAADHEAGLKARKSELVFKLRSLELVEHLRRGDRLAGNGWSLRQIVARMQQRADDRGGGGRRMWVVLLLAALAYLRQHVTPFVSTHQKRTLRRNALSLRAYRRVLRRG